MPLPLLARALLSAATTPSMPAWPTLKLAGQRWDRRHVSQDPAALQDRLLALLAQHAVSDPWRLPWAAEAPLSLSAVSAALIGRADDYAGPLPAAWLPAAPAHRLLSAMSAAGGPLDVCEQYALALQHCGGHPLAAAVVLHCGLRTLARGADRRAGLALWLDERLALGAAIAAFAPVLSEGRDPLGDNRHYWAMVCAGLVSVGAKQTGRREAGRGMHAAAFFAPEAIAWSRRWLGGPVFEARRVSRMGLRHGISLGVAAARQARTAPERPLQEAASETRTPPASRVGVR